MGSNTFVPAYIWTVAQTEQGNVVLVRPKESDMVVPIFIGQLETQSILIGLGKVEMPRPLTHDLLLSTVNALEADIARIEIRELRDRTFYANIVIKSIEGEITIDARPSDAIALAVRCNAEVYISEEIVDAAGVPVDMIRESPLPDDATLADDSLPFSLSTSGMTTLSGQGSEAERERLQEELELAIANEDYEQAAAIRDKLKLI